MPAIVWWLRLGVGVALMLCLGAAVVSGTLLVGYVAYARLTGRPELLDGIRTGTRPWRSMRP